MTKIHVLYGFSPQLAPFRGLSAAESIALLREWGVQAVFGGYDNAAFVDAAHAAGLQVFAEFGCFVGERWWDRYPESRPVTADGRLMPKQGWYAGVIPTLPALRQELLAGLEKLVMEKDLDGVWLDFIRWPTRWESPDPALYQTSFDPRTLQRFQADTGIRIPTELKRPEEIALWVLSEQGERWTAWRCEQITSFVRQAGEITKRAARRPCLLGLFSVPWRTADFDGAIIRVMGGEPGVRGTSLRWRPMWISSRRWSSTSSAGKGLPGSRRFLPTPCHPRWRGHSKRRRPDTGSRCGDRGRLGRPARPPWSG